MFSPSGGLARPPNTTIRSALPGPDAIPLFYSTLHWHPLPAVRSRAGGRQTTNSPEISPVTILLSFSLFEFHTQNTRGCPFGSPLCF